MAAQGIAKRATINVKSHFDQQAIDTFEHSLKDLGQTSTHLRDSFDRTNEAFDRFDEHMEMFSQHHSSAMDRLRESDNRAIASDRRFSQRMNDTMDTYNRDADRFSNDTHRINESELSKAQNAANNEHKINESLSHSMTQMRRNSDEIVRENKVMNDHLNHVGVSSTHMGDRISSANGRVARSFHTANSSIGRHIQSVRDAQSRDYRWLRTAQDMSGATLGLGAAFYKGAKDATTLQQAYIHAGNMAHYGGEKMSQVQHDINEQWRVGSQLSVKYGVSQDQIAKGYQALVARGYTTNEALHTQKSLLQASIASGDDYNDVVKDSTNVLDAYNLRSQNAATMTNNTRKVTNELAYAADQTASNYRSLGIGMAYVAATAHTTDQPISETSSALGILSNKGMQASMAGVGLRKVLNSFLSINKKGQQAQVMQQLGLTQNSFRTASGHLKSLGQLMGILNEKTKNMGSAERGAVFHRFFGATGQEAALNLASDTKGLAQLNKQVKKAQTMGSKQQGYVALLSQHNMKSAQNQFNKFKQAWQAFTITSAREILPEFTGALKHLDVYLAKLNDLSPRAKKWTIFGALAVAAISPISYAIFGIQSAFHGVEMTLLHVRKLFSRPMPKGMTDSANTQAGQQEKDALEQNIKTGRSSYLDKLSQSELDHPQLTRMRLRRQRLGASIWATNRGALSHITNIGGDYRFKPGMTAYEKMVARPSMMARVNPFNKSARLFTHRFTSWIPGVHRLPTVTGRSASYMLRGSGIGAMSRLGGSLLGKANIITGIASSLPLVEKGLKWIDHTRIGGKIFAPFNKSLIKGMNGPVKFINRSWKFIKRGALDAIKPIENEWHKMFSGESKSSRANLRGLKEFVHISTSLIGGLFRTIAKVAGNLLKYGGHALAGVMKTLRGVGTLAGAVADLFTGHWKRAWYLFKHGANITLSGVWNTFSGLFKGIATSAGDVLNGVWTSVKHVAKLFAPPFLSAWHVIKKSAIETWHDMIDPIDDFWHAAVHIARSISNAFVNEFENMRDRLDGIIGDIESRISSIGSDLAHPIKSVEHYVHSHAAGGAIPQDEMSLVNERGQESAYNPAKNTFRLLGNNGPQVLKLYQGEHVLDAQDTHELLNGGLGRGVTLPGYANGTDKLNNIRNKKLHGYSIGTAWKDYSDYAKIASWDPTGTVGWTAAPADLINGIRSGHPIMGSLSAVGDLPGATDAKYLSRVPKVGAFLARHLPTLGRLTGKAGSFLGRHVPIAGKDISHLLGKTLPNIGNKILTPISSTAGKYLGKAWKGLHGLADKAIHKAPGELKKLPALGHSMLHWAGNGLKHFVGQITGPMDKRIRRGVRHIVPIIKHGWNGIKRLSRGIGSGLRRFGRGISRRAGQVWRGAKRMGRNALRGLRSFGGRALRGAKQLGSRAWRGIKGFGHGTMRLGKRMFRTAGRGLRRFGRGTMRFGRRMFRGGRRLLRRASRGISKFARHTWSGAKHLGRRLWSGTKHVARRMWSTTRRTARRMWTSAKRTGRNIWNNTKRIARSIGRTAHSLWNRTKAGASRTWSHVVSGARRMARAIGSRVRSMVSSAKSKARSAWSAIKSGVSSAVSTVRSKVSSMVSWVISEAHRAMSVLSHIHIPHFANGGPISKTTMALVGEHGPETAYNARTGMIRMLGMNGPQITTLLAGEEVLTNTQTNRLLHGGLGRGNHLPAYAKGTDAQLSGPASRTSLFNIIGSFSGKRAINNMNDFSKKAKAIWDDVSSYITSGSQDMSKSVTKTNSDLSDSVRDIFKDMSKKVGSLSDDLRDGLVEAAKDMAEGFGDKFKKLITYAKDDMEDVIDKLNRGVSGIDVALKAFGGNSHVIHKIHYATGTMNGRLTHDQIGILNDAITGPRQEAILRDGQILMPQGDNVPVPLQKGDAVLNGDQTKQLINNTTNINHYAKGSGFHFNMKRVNSLIKVLSLALKGPAAFFKKSFSSLVGQPSGHQLTKGLDETGIQAVKPLGVKWTRAMFSYIHSLINPPDSGSASASAFLNYAMKLAARAHYHYSEAPGRTGPNHYDCSGLVYAALTHFGIHPSGSTAGPEIFDSGFKPISRSQARIGDLVGNAGHIGIVANNDATKYYSAFSPSMGIGMHPLDTTWWDGGSFNFRRVPQLAKYNQPKHKKATPYLQRLVASELGPTAIHWLKALAPVLNTDSGGAGLAKGNGAISTAWNEFAKLGMSPTQIMGALGGAKQESEFNPLAHDPDGGLGLFQATPPYGNLRAYAAEHHEDWKDPAVQAKQYYEHWLKPSGYLSTHGSVYDEALAAAKVEASSSIHGSLAPDSDFGVRLAGARYIQRWYQMHKHANGGWASSPAIFGEDGPEVAINPAKDTADHYIVEAINARMHNNSNSPISNLVHSMGLSQKSDELRKRINDLLFNHVAKPSKPVKSNPVNINISFGDIVVNGNGGNVNTAAIANKVKKAVQHGIQQAAYRTTHKLNLD